VYNSAGGYANGSNFNYLAAANVAANVAWTEYTGVVPVGGIGYTAPVTIKLIALLNYGGSVGYMEVQDFRLEEILPGTLIQDGVITTNKIAANAITAAKIAALTITAAEIATNTITADKLVANSITAGQIQAGAISTTELAAGAITADKISVGTITADRLIVGTITAASGVLADKWRSKQYRSGTHSIANATATLSAENTSVYNIGSIEVSGRVTIPTGGDVGAWAFEGQVTWTSNATGLRTVSIKKNGTTILVSNIVNAVNGANTLQQIRVTVSAPAVGDYYEMELTQTSGNPLNTVGSSENDTYFGGIHLW